MDTRPAGTDGPPARRRTRRTQRVPRARGPACALAAALLAGALAAFDAGGGEPSWRELMERGSALVGDGKMDQAEEVFRAALEEAEGAGTSGPRLVKSVMSLADVQRHLGDHAGAEALYRRALAEWEKALGRVASGSSPEATRRGGHNLYSVKVMLRLAEALEEQGKLEEAEGLYRRALPAVEKIEGRDHPAAVRTAGALAVLLKRQRKYDEAEPLYRRSVSLAERSLGPNHPATARAVGRLARFYHEQEKYGPAEEHYLKSLAAWKAAVPAGNADRAETLMAYADVLEKTGRVDEAKTAKESASRMMRDHVARLRKGAAYLAAAGKHAEAVGACGALVEVLEKVLGKEHPSLASPLRDLGAALILQKKHGRAERVLRRALAIVEGEPDATRDGPAGPALAAVSAASVLETLGDVRRAKGDLDGAVELYRRALAAAESAGAGDRAASSALRKLGSLHAARGRHQDAERSYRRALELDEAATASPEGNDVPGGGKARRPDLADDLVGLAESVAARGGHDEAESLYRRALAIYEKDLGAEDPAVATTLAGLALVKKKQGDHGAAERLNRRALALSERAAGSDAPSVASGLSNLACLYLEQGRYDEAEPLLQRALEIYGKHFGIGHPDVATAAANLAGILARKGRYEEAEKILTASLSAREDALDRDHPGLATLMGNLAAVLMKQEKYERAAPLLERALAASERGLGAAHPSTVKILKSYAFTLRRLGRDEAAAELVRRLRRAPR